MVERKRDSLTKKFKKVERERGLRGGSRFRDVVLAAIKEGRTPGWIKDYRASWRPEDLRGVDGVFETDVGKIPVQLKSSEKGAEEARKRHPKIPVIIITMDDDKEEIMQKCLEVIGEERAKILKLRGQNQ